MFHKPFPFSPGHTVKLHSPASFAIDSMQSCDWVLPNEMWVKGMWIIPVLAHKTAQTLTIPLLSPLFWSNGRTVRTVGAEGLGSHKTDPEPLSHKLENSYSEEPLDQQCLCWMVV